MKKTLTVLACLLLSLPVIAHTDYKHEVAYPLAKTAPQQTVPLQLVVGTYGGNGAIAGAYKQDGQFGQGRFSLGVSLAVVDHMSLGLEAGMQSGNSMRLSANRALLEAINNIPAQATLKPLTDLLITAKAQLLPNQPLFGVVKGGVAYRQLTLEGRTSARDGLRKVNGELQLGLAYNLSNRVTLTALYQGIYAGGNAGLTLDKLGDVKLTRIPTQQAGFVGLEYSL